MIALYTSHALWTGPGPLHPFPRQALGFLGVGVGLQVVTVVFDRLNEGVDMLYNVGLYRYLRSRPRFQKFCYSTDIRGTAVPSVLQHLPRCGLV